MTRAPLSLPGRIVIFDYGDVISLAPSAADRAVLTRLAGVDGAVDDGADGAVDGGIAVNADGGAGGASAERFWHAYWAHRDGLDQGTAGVAAYWRAISDAVGARWDEARVHELWVADFRGWLSVNPETVEVLADLRAGGTRLALLSNAGRDFGSYFRHGPLGDFFERCYVSGELGLLKPDAAIYRHVLADLSIAAAEAVFIDNRETNVAGARAVGITGHVYTGTAALRAFLTALAGPTGD